MLGTVAFILSSHHVKAQNIESPEYDSTVLKSQFVYVCEGHFFEWCNEEVNCGYCNEPLQKMDLWAYYKKLECEDCKSFFDENYPSFINKE
ncbi:MAG: hypothetical protein HKP14_07260 [Bacteroidia bacterium]|nr:hypothetical protein [Bacteroidia bacterium]